MNSQSPFSEAPGCSFCTLDSRGGISGGGSFFLFCDNHESWAEQLVSDAVKIEKRNNRRKARRNEKRQLDQLQIERKLQPNDIESNLSLNLTS